MEEHERSDAEFVTTKLGDVMSRNFSGEPHAQLRRAFVYKEKATAHTAPPRSAPNQSRFGAAPELPNVITRRLITRPQPWTCAAGVSASVPCP